MRHVKTAKKLLNRILRPRQEVQSILDWMRTLRKNSPGQVEWNGGSSQHASFQQDWIHSAIKFQEFFVTVPHFHINNLFTTSENFWQGEEYLLVHRYVEEIWSFPQQYLLVQIQVPFKKGTFRLKSANVGKACKW